jgi:hypothetical protein
LNVRSAEKAVRAADSERRDDSAYSRKAANEASSAPTDGKAANTPTPSTERRTCGDTLRKYAVKRLSERR